MLQHRGVRPSSPQWVLGWIHGRVDWGHACASSNLRGSCSCCGVNANRCYSSTYCNNDNHNPILLLWVLQQRVLPNVFWILLLWEQLDLGWSEVWTQTSTSNVETPSWRASPRWTSSPPSVIGFTTKGEKKGWFNQEPTFVIVIILLVEL